MANTPEYKSPTASGGSELAGSSGSPSWQQASSTPALRRKTKQIPMDSQRRHGNFAKRKKGG